MDEFNWFVLQVTTGKENKLKKIIDSFCVKKIDTVVFSSRLNFKRKGKYKLVNRTLFPGYLFIKDDPLTGIETIKNVLKKEYIVPICFKTIKCNKCYTEKSPCMVSPIEMKILLNLCSNNGSFDISYGYKEGEEIIIEKGPLKSIGGKILKINSRKKVATVELELFKRKLKITLGFELLNKRSESKNS